MLSKYTDKKVYNLIYLTKCTNKFIKKYPETNKFIGKWYLNPFIQIACYEPNKFYKVLHCENDGNPKNLKRVVETGDNTNLFDNKGILHSLNIVKESPKKVLYGNTFNYYDYYALRSSHSIFSLLGPEINGEFVWKNQFNNNMFLSLDYKSDNLFET